MTWTRNRIVAEWLIPGAVGLAVGASLLGGLWVAPAIAIALLGAVAFFLPRPVLLFVVYCASIPLEDVLVAQGWEGATLTRYIGIAAAAVLTIHMARTGRVNKPPLGLFAWVGFFAWAAISMLWTITPDGTWPGVWHHLRFLILYAIVIAFPFADRDVQLIKKTVILSGLVAASIVIYQFINQVTYLETVRASIALGGLAADPNILAASLLLPFGLLLSDYLAERRSRPTLHLLPLLLFPVAIILTGSRGGLLGLLVVGGCLLLVYFGREAQHRIRLLMLTSLAAGSFWFLWPLLPTALTERFVLTEMVAGGGAGRLDAWRISIGAWLENPFLGYGFASFSTVNVLSGGTAIVSHNIYLQALVELGLPGLGLLLAALLLSLNYNWKSSLVSGTTAGLLGLLAASFFVVTINRDYFWLALMLAALSQGLVNGATARREPEKSEANSTGVLTYEDPHPAHTA